MLISAILVVVLAAVGQATAQAADGISSASDRPPVGLLALSYHDVVDLEAQTLTDRLAVTSDQLIQHFSWLAGNGYQPISLQQWRDAQQGGPLPDKPVLLTFDDGYASFYTKVLPLLELYGFPAVLAPVTSWIDTPEGKPVRYGDELRSRDDFLTWQQLRDIQASNLVEIASHSHDLHRGVYANPYGNLLPAAAARAYLQASNSYETDAQYQQRLQADLLTSVQLLETELGRAPTTVVWPYGAFNDMALDVARQVGMDWSMSLESLPNRHGHHNIHRVLVGADTDLRSIAQQAQRVFVKPLRETPLRAAHLDLDYVYDADDQQMQANLDVLLDRIKALQINAVFLQAFADPDGDGVASAVYFPNRHMPVRADLFNRVAWQLATRAEVAVYAWMPVLAFRLPDDALNQQLAVVARDGSHEGRYHRLSPYASEARRIITEIYADLGRYSRFGGVLFHDDAFLTEQEDVSQAARRVGADTHQAPAHTAALVDFTQHLAATLERWQPGLKTARNLYARLVLEPESEAWFAQNFQQFLQHYDYTALMAMPYLEGARRPRAWLRELVAKVAAHDQTALAKTVFHMQTRDWRNGRPISNRELRKQFNLLLRKGALNIAYYPDDFVGNHPDLHMLRSNLSVNRHPALRQ